MTVQYKQLRDPTTSEIRDDFVIHTDLETGAQTTMPVAGMWMSNIYQAWLAAGGVVTPADPLPDAS